MSFCQKIYYNNKPLILAENGTDLSPYPTYHHFRGISAAVLHQGVRLLEQGDIPGVLITDDSREHLEKELLWAFYPVHSAGGVVQNEAGEVLMIFRRGKWDLPKGKQDEGEDIETCAVREVREETGLKTVELKRKICNTLHIYPMNHTLVLKYTAWYLMSGTSTDTLQPQTEEKIEQVAWVNAANIPPLLHNSFETIQDVLTEANIL